MTKQELLKYDRRLQLEQISKLTYCRNEFIIKRYFKVFGEKKIRNLDLYDWCDFLEEQIPRREGIMHLRCMISAQRLNVNPMQRIIARLTILANFCIMRKTIIMQWICDLGKGR